MILMSDISDQLSMYSTSISTISSKLSILLRPFTCHIPVIPGLILMRRHCFLSYFSTSSSVGGLGQGLPEKIPVVTKDFVFAAISEELGGVFALCLIMVCVSCFFMIMNVAMKLRDNYYRLTAVGLGTLYALQVFLTIGGVIKFIPSTGVTLPLVSYGGSSLLSTMIVFGIIQGLYIMQFDGRTQKKEQKRRRGRKE